MTDITCHAITCIYNSAEFMNDCSGTCMLEHISLPVKGDADDEEFDFKCNQYELSYDKPYRKKDDEF